MERTFEKIAQNGTLPAARWGHSLNVYEGKLVLFGGTGAKQYNDTFIFSPDSNSWRKVDGEITGRAPEARFGHTSELIGDKIWLFGGNAGNGKYLNDIYTLDLKNRQWTKIAVANKKSIPKARANHTSVVIDKKILIFGGSGSGSKHFKDLHEFDTENITWRKIKITGTPKPSPRAGHSAFAVGNNMFIFGGTDGRTMFNDIWVLDTVMNTWNFPKTGGTAPHERSGQCIAVVGKSLHIFAGYGSNNEFLNDVRILNLEKMEWLPLSSFTVSANNFSRRFRQASAVVNNKIYLFGGSGSGVLLSDMFTLKPCTLNEREREHADGMELDIMERVSSHHEAMASEKHERERMNIKIGEIENKLATEGESRKKIETDIEELNLKLKNEREKRKKKEKEKKVIEDLLNATRVDLEILKKLSQSHEEQLKTLADTNIQLKTQLEDAKHDRESLESRMKELIHSNTLLLSQLNAARKETQSLTERLYDFETQTIALNSRLDEEIKFRLRIQKQYADLKANKMPSRIENTTSGKRTFTNAMQDAPASPIMTAEGSQSVESTNPSEELSFRSKLIRTEEALERMDLESVSPLDAAFGTNSLVKHYKQAIKDLRYGMTIKLKDRNTPFKLLQREISDLFLSLLRDCAADVEFSLGKPPCRYSIFAGGSIARGEAALYSDFEFGIVIERKEPDCMDYFLNYSKRVGEKLQYAGVKCDDNFAPPHISRSQIDRSQKDKRGVFFVDNSVCIESEKMERKGNPMLIDTPEGFANWQVEFRQNEIDNRKLVKSDISGSAILASILREACFVYGDPSLFTKFNTLTFDSLDSSKNSRKGFYNSTLASISQNIYKLPRKEHIDSALFLNNFPIAYDLKDLLKSIYLIVMGQSLVQDVRENNTYVRITKLKAPPNNSETYLQMKDQLLTYYEFLSRLRLIAQVHYNRPYHKVLGTQILKRELKNFKGKFMEKNASIENNRTGLSKANIEWLNKMLYNIKSEMMDEDADSFSSHITKKISKLWKTVFNTELEEVKEDSITLIENRLKEYELNLDTSKYFVVKDKQGSEVRTKPLTVVEIENLRKRLDRVKSMLKEAWEDFYVDVILSPPAIQLMERDLVGLSSDISSLKTPVELNPLILSSSQVYKVNDCIEFIQNIFHFLQTLTV